MKINRYLLFFFIFLTVISLLIIYKFNIITLVATGDVVLARSINYNSVVKFNDFFYPWDKVRNIFKLSDIALINLEGPFIKNCPVTNKKIAVFCGDERHVQGLKDAGINIVNIANNHIEDYGKEGKENTINLLKKANITISGASSEPARIVKKGVKFAFLGFNDVNCTKVFCEKEKNLAALIKKTKLESDILIVSFHWGEQYTDRPTDRQKYLGHLAINSGADIVIGNHPHWIQPVEIYKEKIIIYSSGNFIFDQQWSKETRNGIISKFVFFGKKLIYFKLIPVYINKYSQPEPQKL
jgi:poly-gamma-glutamate synthesis protein (capsule biosynthesis protein)